MDRRVLVAFCLILFNASNGFALSMSTSDIEFHTLFSESSLGFFTPYDESSAEVGELMAAALAACAKGEISFGRFEGPAGQQTPVDGIVAVVDEDPEGKCFLTYRAASGGRRGEIVFRYAETAGDFEQLLESSGWSMFDFLALRYLDEQATAQAIVTW